MMNMFEVLLFSFGEQYFFAADYRIEDGDIVWLDDEGFEIGRVIAGTYASVIQCTFPTEESGTNGDETPDEFEVDFALDILDKYFANHGAARIMLDSLHDFVS